MTDRLTRACARRFPWGAPLALVEAGDPHIFTGDPDDVDAAIARHEAKCRAEAWNEPAPRLNDAELQRLMEEVAAEKGVLAAIDHGAAALAASRRGDSS